MPRHMPYMMVVEKQDGRSTYSGVMAGKAVAQGLVTSELSSHLGGRLVGGDLVSSDAFDRFAPAAVRGNDAARRAWWRRGVRRFGELKIETREAFHLGYHSRHKLGLRRDLC